jgi:hypothetical protein
MNFFKPGSFYRHKSTTGQCLEVVEMLEATDKYERFIARFWVLPLTGLPYLEDSEFVIKKFHSETHGDWVEIDIEMWATPSPGQRSLLTH